MSFLKWFTNWLDQRGSGRMIIRDDSPYLKRYYIWRSKRLTILLHQFWSSDPDHVHDHPWRNASFVIKGGYFEHFADGTKITRKPWDFIMRDAISFHRIEIPEEAAGKAYTIFFTGKRVRKWGFLTPEGWVAAKEYGDQPVDIEGRDFIVKGHLFPRLVWLKERRND